MAQDILANAPEPTTNIHQWTIMNHEANTRILHLDFTPRHVVLSALNSAAAEVIGSDLVTTGGAVFQYRSRLQKIIIFQTFKTNQSHEAGSLVIYPNMTCPLPQQYFVPFLMPLHITALIEPQPCAAWLPLIWKATPSHCPAKGPMAWESASAESEDYSSTKKNKSYARGCVQCLHDVRTSSCPWLLWHRFHFKFLITTHGLAAACICMACLLRAKCKKLQNLKRSRNTSIHF